ncbi:MAG: nucleotidyltransferase family protein [Clostridia bacterium]|nr:nucleotidyltransferase family protein [Clostridia bacterium]
MKLCATIAEFNPFHNGHKYLVDSFKNEFDGTVAIMSGNFVQRGDVAVFNKFARANAAVAGGFDLVIELPVIYALSSAETFAEGAVKTLNSANSIDTLFFGSEEGKIEPLFSASALAANESEAFSSALKEKLSLGLSYPKALCEVYKAFGVPESVVSSPNNILGIEYIKALLKTNSSITPATIERSGAHHDSYEASESIASASYVRSLIENGEGFESFLPAFSYPSPVFSKAFSDIILYAVRSASIEDFAAIYDCSDELSARFMSADTNSVEDIISSVKSKNFTESRIRRILWNLVIKNTLSPKTEPSYIRILAQNKKGSEIISYMKKNASLPIVQKGAQLKDDPIFLAEARATDIYNIIAKLPSGEDFRHSPIPVN